MEVGAVTEYRRPGGLRSSNVEIWYPRRDLTRGEKDQAPLPQVGGRGHSPLLVSQASRGRSLPCGQWFYICTPWAVFILESFCFYWIRFYLAWFGITGNRRWSGKKRCCSRAQGTRGKRARRLLDDRRGGRVATRTSESCVRALGWLESSAGKKVSKFHSDLYGRFFLKGQLPVMFYHQHAEYKGNQTQLTTGAVRRKQRTHSIVELHWRKRRRW